MCFFIFWLSVLSKQEQGNTVTDDETPYWEMGASKKCQRTKKKSKHRAVKAERGSTVPIYRNKVRPCVVLYKYPEQAYDLGNILSETLYHRTSKCSYEREYSVFLAFVTMPSAVGAWVGSGLNTYFLSVPRGSFRLCLSVSVGAASNDKAGKSLAHSGLVPLGRGQS